MLTISSTQNQLFKQCRVWLEKSRKRKEDGVVLVEGLHEIECAIRAGCKPLHWIQSTDFSEVALFKEQFPNCAAMAPALFDQLVIRKSGQVALAVLGTPLELPLSLNPKGCYLVVESVEKPGNLGAILRSADAAGIEAVILCDPRVDRYNPQVIRNSVGAVFSVPLWSAPHDEVWEAIQSAGLRLYSTYMENSQSFWEADLGSGCAVVIGTEHEGVSPFWKGKGQNVQIPMNGQVDSLNVSVAAALLVFEMARRR